MVNPSKKKAVFLDRDGVINKALIINGKPYAPSNFLEFEVLPGLKENLQNLKIFGYQIIVVTNQPDISTGKLKLEHLEKMHEYLINQYPIDLIKYCPHLEKDNCSCRKPNPGMFFNAAKELKLDLSKSFIIGDRWRDITAGQNAGCRECYFIDYNYSEIKPKGKFTVVDSLKECVYKISMCS
jgi:D-glycero-D-manno-heptose 1,7-bisphosphate phosphatase